MCGGAETTAGKIQIQKKIKLQIQIQIQISHHVMCAAAKTTAGRRMSSLPKAHRRL